MPTDTAKDRVTHMKPYIDTVVQLAAACAIQLAIGQSKRDVYFLLVGALSALAILYLNKKVSRHGK